MDFASVTALAEDMSGGAVLLSGGSIALLLCALGESAEKRRLWTGSAEFGGISDAEWDTIQSMVGLCEREIMKNGLTGTFSYVLKIPDGALLCDGAICQRVDYPSLYEAWEGTALILDENSFRLPDLRDRVVIGTSQNHSLLATGGEESHNLTDGEMPSHSHSIPGTATALAVSPGELPVLIPLSVSLTGSVGADLAHNNMQPYISLLGVVWT